MPIVVLMGKGILTGWYVEIIYVIYTCTIYGGIEYQVLGGPPTRVDEQTHPLPFHRGSIS